MAYGTTEAAARPNLPVNAALSTSLEQLHRCHSLAEAIRAHIHGTVPEPLSAMGKGEEALPRHSSAASNLLSIKLEALGNLLEDISNSF